MSDPLYTPKQRAEVLRRNIFSLPRWMRRVFEAKEHTNEGEEARRRRQIESGFLGAAGRGTTKIGGEDVEL